MFCRSLVSLDQLEGQQALVGSDSSCHRPLGDTLAVRTGLLGIPYSPKLTIIIMLTVNVGTHRYGQ